MITPTEKAPPDILSDLARDGQANAVWVRTKISERGWTQEIENMAQYLIKTALDDEADTA